MYDDLEAMTTNTKIKQICNNNNKFNNNYKIRRIYCITFALMYNVIHLIQKYILFF